MAREYSIPISPTAVTVQVDLWEVAPADDKPVEIHSIRLFQTSDLGDAAEEIIGIEIRRGGTAMTTGSGGTQGVTPALTNPGDSACSAACDTLNTTLATFTGGGLVDIDGWNVRQPYLYVPPPEDRIVVTQTNGGLVVRLSAAPADSLTIGGTIVFAETG